MLHMVAVHAKLRLHFQLQAAWIDSATEDDYWTTERTQRLHELLQNDEDDEAFCRGHEPDLSLGVANLCKSLTAQPAIRIFQHTRVELPPLGVPCIFDVELPQLNVLGVVCDFSAGLPQLNMACDFDKKTEGSVCVADGWLAADRELFKTNDSSLSVYSALVFGGK